ncbi:MAG: insulinase family protein [Firmicutes bacterium]|nr:insulinase family protein [Bacillota bacterium]
MYKRKVLSQGVRLVAEEIPTVSSVAVGFWVNVGSRWEMPAEAGLSHLLEHLLFKGTTKRSARAIAEALDSVGGQLNAFTTKEYTCYYAKVLSEHVPLALDVLSDMLLDPLLTAEDIEREKQVVLEEIRMYEDSPDELVHDLLTGVAWPDHPLGRPTLGTEETLSSLTPDHIRAFHERHYTPDNLVITVAGNLEYEKVRELLERQLQGRQATAPQHCQPAPVFSPGLQIFERDTEQVHVCLGAKGIPVEDDTNYVVDVLNSILGGGLSSRLFQHIREEKGLAYSVYSYHTAYQGAGLFTVYLGLSEEKLQEGLSLVRAEMANLGKEEVSTAELERAKQQVLGGFLLGLENTTNRMIRLGKQELSLGRYVSPQEVKQKIGEVTAAAVREVCAKVFRPEQLTTVVLGPKVCGELE